MALQKLLAISTALLLSGCAIRIGPKTIVPDRFDYSSAIGRSWKEQMVLNMVKLRYLDPNFYKFLGMLRELQRSDSIGMRVQAEGAEGSILIFRGTDVDPATLATGQAVRKLLKLNPDTTEISLVFGSTARNDKEIAVLTRSMLEILQEAAAGVDVPVSHQAEGRVVPMQKQSGSGGFGPRLAIPIQSSEKKPSSDDAFAVVRYRGHWFWISDRDVAAKRGLSFLLILFSLTETGITATPPVLTISKP